MTAPDHATWATRLRDRRDARIAAMAAEAATIRDARAANMKPADIAEALGVARNSRSVVYGAAARVPDGDVEQPARTPVVYLRGAGRPPSVWHEVEQAMWLRGWATEHDRTTAWHAARGGTPVVGVKFSLHSHFTVQDVAAGLLRARYGEAGDADGRNLELVWLSRGVDPDIRPAGLADRLAALVGAALVGALPDAVSDDALRL